MTLVRLSIHLKDLEGEILSWLKTVAAQLKDPSQMRAGGRREPTPASQ